MVLLFINAAHAAIFYENNFELRKKMYIMNLVLSHLSIKYTYIRYSLQFITLKC